MSAKGFHNNVMTPDQYRQMKAADKRNKKKKGRRK